MADQFNYFFRFVNQEAANYDPIVGPYLAINNTINPLTVYNIGSNSVEYFNDYWCMVLAPDGIAALQTHPNLQFELDRDLETDFPAQAVIINNLAPPLLIQNIQIITAYGLPYMVRGMGGQILPPLVGNLELRQDFGHELREDLGLELRE